MTAEQRTAFERFRAIASPLRLRVVSDAEGFPISPGRYGQLEWHDTTHVAIYSQTMRMLAKLTRIPGVRHHQIGDCEFRLLVAADQVHDSGDIRAISRLLRIRVRRVLSEGQKLTLLDRGRPFQRAAIGGPTR